MKSFYQYLLEVSATDTVGFLCDKFLKNIRRTYDDEQRYLPMFALADYMEENLLNEYKANQIREMASSKDLYNLKNACNKYLQDGFFTTNTAYDPNISSYRPQLLVLSNNYPLHRVTDNIDERGIVVSIASLTNIRQAIISEAVKRQMGINQYIRTIYDTDQPINNLVDLNNTDLEFYYRDFYRPRTLTNLVNKDGEMAAGSSEINERITDRFMEEELPDIVGEEVAKMNYLILKDLEYYNA